MIGVRRRSDAGADFGRAECPEIVVGAERCCDLMRDAKRIRRRNTRQDDREFVGPPIARRYRRCACSRAIAARRSSTADRLRRGPSLSLTFLNPSRSRQSNAQGHRARLRVIATSSRSVNSTRLGSSSGRHDAPGIRCGFGLSPLGNVLIGANPAAIRQRLMIDRDQPPIAELLQEGPFLAPIDMNCFRAR